jgi:exonuclease SbcC
MKILKVSFQNINSLKGSHDIDFRKPPLDKAPLFAITGPTGSGKSTILDVICLALYNQIPRMGTVSKNSIAAQGSILTRNKKEARASVTYACKSGVFTSEWRIKINKNGNLSDYEMSLYDENDTSLGLKKGQIPPKNAELIGLEYNQFIRSILLAQGEFAEFLKAKESERTIILEKITGGFIYRELGRLAHEKAKDLKEKTADLQKLIEEYEAKLLTDEVCSQKLVEQKRLKEELREKRASLQQLDRAKVLKEELISLNSKKMLTNEELNSAKNQLRFFEENEGIKLAKHQKLAPFKEQLIDWDEAVKQQLKLQASIASQKLQVNELAEVKSGLVLKVVALVGEGIGEDELKERLQKFSANYSALDAELGKVKIQYAGLVKSLGAFELSKIIEMQNLNTDEERLSAVQHKQKELSISLEGLDVELAKNPFSGITDSAILRDYELKIQRLMLLSASKNKAKEAFVKRNVELEMAKEAMTQLPTKIDEQEKLCLELDKLLKISVIERDLKKLRASLTDHRNDLVQGEPCALCGSLEHPWAEDSPNISVNEEKIKQLDYNLKEATSTKQSLSLQYERLTTNLENLQASIADLKLEIAQNETEEKSINAIFSDGVRALTATEMASLLNECNLLLERQSQEGVFAEKLEKSVPILKETVEIAKIHIDKTIELKKLYSGVKPLEEVVADYLLQWDKFQSTMQIAAHDLKKGNVQAIELSEQIQKSVSALTPTILGDTAYLHLKDALKDVLTHDQEQALRAKFDKIKEAVTRLEQSAVDQMAQLKEKREKDVLASFEELLEKLQQKTTVIEEVENRLLIVSSAIDQQLMFKEQITQKKQTHDSIVGNGYKWLLLDKHIGDAKGKRFSSFAQQLTLSHLVSLANNRLRNLNKRFLLKAPDMETSNDELLIIDREMGDETRSVKTLSGGESFIISLALSLGLSDLAAKNIQIESMFIDEGFGTLDPESLDQILDVLENLQASDAKTIGVISHVDALKERITTQIRLKPTGQGYSELSIV